jgi:hypothetical protein
MIPIIGMTLQGSIGPIVQEGLIVVALANKSYEVAIVTAQYIYPCSYILRIIQGV